MWACFGSSGFFVSLSWSTLWVLSSLKFSKIDSYFSPSFHGENKKGDSSLAINVPRKYKGEREKEWERMRSRIWKMNWQTVPPRRWKPDAPLINTWKSTSWRRFSPSASQEKRLGASSSPRDWPIWPTCTWPAARGIFLWDKEGNNSFWQNKVHVQATERDLRWVE